ncbi:MAG: hypothetical protein SGILL_009926, partial [Bacillariaceae sp.]
MANSSQDDDNAQNDNHHPEMAEIRQALQHAVCKIVLKEDRHDHMRTTGAAMSALTELALAFCVKALVPDLYAFSTHAGRKSTISTDDVALMMRKLPPQQYQAFCAEFGKVGGKNAGAAVTNKNNKSPRRNSGGGGGKRTSRQDDNRKPAAKSTAKVGQRRGLGEL